MVAFLDKRANLFRVVASDDGALERVFPRPEQILVVEGAQLVPHHEVGRAAQQAYDAEDVGRGIAGAEAVQYGQQAHQDTGQEQQQAVMLLGGGTGGGGADGFPVAGPAETFQATPVDEVSQQAV